MDPVSVIVGALAAGATVALKETGAAAVKDAYAALKALIADRFKKKNSLESLEEKPDSRAKQAAVKEDLEDANAGGDKDVLALAHSLFAELKKLDADPFGPVGFKGSDLEAGFIKLGNITSTGSGVIIERARVAGGIEVGDINVGTEPHRP